jgi:hypothetical protein
MPVCPSFRRSLSWSLSLPLPLRLLQAAVAVSACSVSSAVQAVAQGPAHAVVLIVTDGLRWQDVFTGADTALMSRQMGGVGDTAGLRREFWRATAAERRRVIFPFLWDSVATRGAIWGNPAVGGDARVTNGLKFSYPGYNEMLSGAPDARIDRNDYGANPNVTVFEWLNTLAAYKGRASAFATWGVFTDIFNQKRSGLIVHSGWAPPLMRDVGTADPTLDRLFRTTTELWHDNALDALTQAALVNHVKARKPRALFVGYGETDEWAHGRRYDLVLKAARNVDGFIAELWRVMQAIPEYRGRTTFIITTDHGRGDGNRWTDHGEEVDGAERIWIAAMGPGIAAQGEVHNTAVTQAQIAATVASLLGEDFTRFNGKAARPFVSASLR